MVLLASIVALIAIFAYQDYRRSIDAAGIEVRNAAEALEAGANLAISQTGEVLNVLRSSWNSSPGSPGPTGLRRSIASHLRLAPQVSTIVVIGRGGRVTHQAGNSIDFDSSARPVIAASRRRGDGLATTGRPRRDAKSGKWLLPVWRSMPQTGGIIIGFIDLERLAKPVRNASMLATGGRQFVLAGGTLVAEKPSRARRRGRQSGISGLTITSHNAPIRAVELKSRVKGATWITAYRAVAGKVVVAAAVRKWRVLGVWLQRRYGQLMTSMLAVLLLLHFTVTVALHASRRRRAEGALRLAEMKLSEALEALAEGFALFDAEDRLSLCNERLRVLLPGMDEQLKISCTYEALMRHGAKSGIFLGANTNPDWLNGRLSTHQKSLSSFELALSNGSWLRVSERRTHDGGTVAIVSDITRSKQREIALSDAKVQAESANHAKTDFLANMSHELRTPLNAIIGFAEVMDAQLFGRLGNDRYNEYAHQICKSAHHLLSIINDILDVSKIESGSFELTEEDVSISALVAEAIGLFAQLSQEKNIALTNKVTEANLRLHIDRKSMKQVLINLISNAVKFTEAEGRVVVNAGIAVSGEFLLQVTDNGIGVAPGDINRVFEAFGQVEGAFVRNHGGTGLGLPLVKGLVERHGGRIYFESEIGKGSKITVVLPSERVIRLQPESISA